jgi:hypothetical protein
MTERSRVPVFRRPNPAKTKQVTVDNPPSAPLRSTSKVTKKKRTKALKKA